jgi:hypothetical protein
LKELGICQRAVHRDSDLSDKQEKMDKKENNHLDLDLDDGEDEISSLINSIQSKLSVAQNELARLKELTKKKDDDHGRPKPRPDNPRRPLPDFPDNLPDDPDEPPHPFGPNTLHL